MTDPTTDSTEFERSIEQFLEAEEALRQLIENAEGLAGAEQRIEHARAGLDGAIAALDDSKTTVSKSAGQLGTLASSLQETSSHFRELLAQIQQLDPTELARVSEETQAEVHKLGARMTEAIEGARSDTAEGLERNREHFAAVDQAIKEAREALHAAIAEATSRVASLGSDVAAVDKALGELRGVLDDHAEVIQRRQTFILVGVIVAIVVAVVALVVGMVP